MDMYSDPSVHARIARSGNDSASSANVHAHARARSFAAIKLDMQVRQ
jgi:hypothetical protein